MKEVVRINRCLYVLLLIISGIFLVITGHFLINNPIWDVKNWYVIAFSNSIITLVIIQLPWVLSRFFKFNLNRLQSVVFYGFTFLTLVVGEAIGVYRITAFYDSFIHFIGGFVLALTGYYVYKRLTKEENNTLMVLFILGFQALFGTIWELFEFGLDYVIGSNTQSYFDDLTQTVFVGQLALRDTMLDFLFNTLGALLFIIVLPKIKVWLEEKN